MMDELDRKLLKELERNPRATCRELSDTIGAPVPTVWDRMTSLERSGCIIGYYAWVSLEALGGLRVIVYGEMKGNLNSEMLRAIEENGQVFVAMTGGQNRLYLMADLRGLADLEGIQRIAEADCRITEPEVLIIGPGSDLGSISLEKRDRASIDSLKEADWQIIGSLHLDARKPISQVAAEVGLTRKTVRKRLSRMVEGGLIEFFVNIDPQKLNELSFLVLVRFGSMALRNRALEILRADRSPSFDHCMVFSNAPNLLGFDMIAGSVAELDARLSVIQDHEGVEVVTWNLCQRRYFFPSWRDRMVEEKAREIGVRKGRARSVSVTYA